MLESSVWLRRDLAVARGVGSYRERRRARPRLSDTRSRNHLVAFQRTGTSRREFYALQEEYRGQAFTISKIAQARSIERVQRKLLQLIGSGGTTADFKKWLQGRQSRLTSR